MIYIDPPYNTGNDFVYNDNFTMESDLFSEVSGEKDEVGNRMVVNSDSNGRYHTDWLNMMYPRLKVSRDLLTEDGLIFISIDDNEVSNLKKICDEIYGTSNFLTCITRSTGTPTGGGFEGLVNEIDYILVYAKDSKNAIINGLPMDEDSASIYDQQDEYGRFLTRSLRRTGGEDRREDRPTMYYAIKDPEGNDVYPKGPTGYDSRWICGKEKYENLVKNHLIAWKKVTVDGQSKWQVYQKFYIEGRTKAPGNLWIDVEGNKKATREVRDLFDSKKLFDYPKPLGVIKKILTIGSEKDCLVLDFFSGSATTAHSVLQYNVENNCNINYIMVQLPEKISEETEAYKEGYKTIPEIGKERIRRAAAKIKSEMEAEGKDTSKMDFGFRVLKLDSSNMKDVYYTPQETSLDTLFTDNVKEDRTAEDLLFQVMPKCDLMLSEKIVKENIKGKEVYFVKDNYLAACFDKDLTDEVITEIAKRQPFHFVMREGGAAQDSVLDNFEQLFRTYSPGTKCMVI